MVKKMLKRMFSPLLLVVAFIIFNSACTAAIAAEPWQIGTPIVRYWSGITLTDTEAKLAAKAGFNSLFLGSESQLDIAGRYGLRAQLWAPEFRDPVTIMDDPVRLAAFDALIKRVRNHPAMYTYEIIDEPNASQFPALGKLVAHLRELDPAHAVYINLFPTYANNAQLGTKGDVVTAYREHLRLFIEQVKPAFLSYDHYQMYVWGDTDQYFLNLALIRDAALGAGLPFINFVQGNTWEASFRAPNANEMRYLNYTSLAYGAQGLQYFCMYGEAWYTDCIKKSIDPGGLILPGGITTTQYNTAAQELNPQFIAVALQLKPLRSLGAYHVGAVPLGAAALPKNAPFYLDFSGEGMSKMPAEGILLGYFGKAGKSGPTHVLVVNLNYKSVVTATVVGPDRLRMFDVVTRKWTRAAGSRVIVTLPPGGGKLIAVAPVTSITRPAANVLHSK